MKRVFVYIAGICLFFVSTGVFAGDLTCYGYTSTTSYFSCGTHGNCTWWAAHKRPDLAAAGITGDARYWYDNAENLGFEVGLQPKVGAIAVFLDPSHVAYVESLGSDGSFGVSEMNWYDSPNDGFSDGVNYATYSPNGDGTYNRDGGAKHWVLKGFIYRRQHGTNLYCDSLNSIWGVCWTPSNTDVSCRGGGDWTLYDFEQGSVIRVSTNEYCPESGGVGGGIPSDPPDTQSSAPDPVNLVLDFDILDPVTMGEFFAGRDALLINKQIRLNIQLKAKQGNANDWMDPNKDTIETDFYVRYDNGSWFKLGREYTRASNLDEGETHTEYMLLTIPSNASQVSFYVKTDAEKELTETNEGDNVSRIETFQVDNFSWLIPIINLILED